jgi:hypothetical protein
MTRRAAALPLTLALSPTGVGERVKRVSGRPTNMGRASAVNDEPGLSPRVFRPKAYGRPVLGQSEIDDVDRAPPQVRKDMNIGTPTACRDD